MGWPSFHCYWDCKSGLHFCLTGARGINAKAHSGDITTTTHIILPEVQGTSAGERLLLQVLWAKATINGVFVGRNTTILLNVKAANFLLMGFKDITNKGEHLFKNEDALDPEWLPKNLPYRESQHKFIANCITPLLQGRNGRNCIISGAPGIGKTAAVKLVLKDLEENPDVNAPDIAVLYVNCWQNNSTYKIFAELCEQLGYKFTQNKNTEDLFKIVQNIVNKKSAVFAFDEVDKVEDVNFLYNIFTDILKKTILMITNYPQWYTEVDARIRSRLLPERIDFKQYNREELAGILKNRMEYAFIQGIWDDAAFNLIVDKVAPTGDIRMGLYLLRESGLAADEQSAKKITVEYAKCALSKVSDFSIKPESELSVDAKDILELIKSQGGKIGDLFRLYQEQGGVVTYKTFQRRVEELSEGGFIDAKKVVGGKDGTTTILSGKNKSLDEF